MDGDDILIIRWAHDEPSPDTIKRKEIEDSVLIKKALENKTAFDYEREVNLEQRFIANVRKNEERFHEIQK